LKTDENKVAEYLAAKGLYAIVFPKEERRNRKTPDFRVFRGNALAFFCEVKSISSSTSEGYRIDPVFNRLTDDIHTAVKQFDAVNPRVETPNVLAFVNHDRYCGILDLIGVLTGKFIAENDQTHPIYLKYSEGRIKEEKARIHLFLWLDDFKPDRFLFSQTHAGFHKSLCGWFEIDQNAIKLIHP